MLFAKNEWAASRSDTFQIPFEDSAAGFTPADREMLGVDCQKSASRESDKIICVGKQMSFIEVVDTPDQSPFRIAPSAKILNVEIANCQQSRSLGLDFTQLLPD